MRNIYIAVAAFLIASLLLFVASFVYLDKEKHKIYYYTVNLDGHNIGAIRIDKFETDARFIYKSVSNIPFFDTFTGSKARIDLDRKYRLESYSREKYGPGSAESIYLENNNGSVSFVSKYGSKFAFLDNMPTNPDTFIFEEDSPVTYLPVIENYDFRKGRSQGFNAITCFSDPSLPPMKRFVTLTSIKNEYIKVDARKIKTENLLLKIRNYPQGSVWVAKSDKALIKVEIPKLGLRITRDFRPKIIEAKDYAVRSADKYNIKEITFKNKNIQFSGTMTTPKGDGAYPAVLLIWTDGPQDREYYGLFTSLADYLSRNGFCVLRFDKRGVGSSGGDMAQAALTNEIEDINAAITYLTSQKEADPRNIILIAHSKGALPALKIAAEAKNVKALVLMAPSLYLGKGDDNGRTDEINRMALKYKWPEKYLALAMRSFEETMDKVKNSKHNSAYIMGKRCYLRALREEGQEKAVETLGKVKVPVLILQGKQDEEVPAETAPDIDKELGDNGNPNHMLKYFGYLDHFLATKVADGIHKMHYEVDKDVLASIKNWLEDVTANNALKQEDPKK